MLQVARVPGSIWAHADSAELPLGESGRRRVALWTPDWGSSPGPPASGCLVLLTLVTFVSPSPQGWRAREWRHPRLYGNYWREKCLQRSRAHVWPVCDDWWFSLTRWHGPQGEINSRRWLQSKKEAGDSPRAAGRKMDPCEDLEVPSSKFHDSRGHEPSELEGAQASGPEALGKECEEMRSQKCRLQSKSGGSRRRWRFCFLFHNLVGWFFSGIAKEKGGLQSFYSFLCKLRKKFRGRPWQPRMKYPGETEENYPRVPNVGEK